MSGLGTMRVRGVITPAPWLGVAVLALIVLLTVVATQQALHSMHHIGHDEAAASCQFEAAAGNVVALAAVAQIDVAPPSTAAFDTLPPAIEIHPVRPLGVADGRAPPSATAA